MTFANFVKTATALAAVLLVASSCTTARYYAGPERPHSELAVVLLPLYDSGFPNLQLESVDGGAGSRTANKIELLPGVHDVEVSCSYARQLVNADAFGRERLRFTAKAGHTYKVRTRVQQGRCTMWIENTSTQASVSERVE